MDEIGNNIDFCFIKFKIEELSKTNEHEISTLIVEWDIHNSFFWYFCLLYCWFHPFCYYCNHFWLSFCGFFEISAPNGTDACGYSILFIVIIFGICMLALVIMYALCWRNWDEAIIIILLFGCNICSCWWTVFVSGCRFAFAITYIYCWNIKDERIINVWHFSYTII